MLLAPAGSVTTHFRTTYSIHAQQHRYVIHHTTICKFSNQSLLNESAGQVCCGCTPYIQQTAFSSIIAIIRQYFPSCSALHRPWCRAMSGGPAAQSLPVLSATERLEAGLSLRHQPKEVYTTELRTNTRNSVPRSARTASRTAIPHSFPQWCGVILRPLPLMGLRPLTHEREVKLCDQTPAFPWGT